MRAAILAITLAAAADAADPLLTHDILRMTCGGAIHAFSGSKIEFAVNILPVVQLVDNFYAAAKAKAVDACPSLEDEEFRRRFVPGLESVVNHLDQKDTTTTCASSSFYTAFTTNSPWTQIPWSGILPSSVQIGVRQFYSAMFPRTNPLTDAGVMGLLPLGWILIMAGFKPETSEDGWWGGDGRISMPQTCSYAHLKATGSCTFAIHLNELSVELQVAVSTCSGSYWPAISVTCGGAGCPSVFMPCTTNANCGGGQVCHAPFKASSDAGINSFFESLYMLGLQQFEGDKYVPGIGQVNKLIAVLAPFLGLDGVPALTSTNDLAICGPAAGWNHYVNGPSDRPPCGPGNTCPTTASLATFCCGDSYFKNNLDVCSQETGWECRANNYYDDDNNAPCGTILSCSGVPEPVTLSKDMGCSAPTPTPTPGPAPTPEPAVKCMGPSSLGKCCKFTGLDTACTVHGGAGMPDGRSCGQTGGPYPMCQVAANGCCNSGYSPAASAALPPAQNATTSAFTYQQQTWLSDATCTGAASSAAPTAVITSGAASCGATTVGSMRVSGTCGAAVVAMWIGSATCAGAASLTMPAVNLGLLKPNTCIGGGGGSVKYTTDCSAGTATADSAQNACVDSGCDSVRRVGDGVCDPTCKTPACLMDGNDCKISQFPAYGPATRAAQSQQFNPPKFVNTLKTTCTGMQTWDGTLTAGGQALSPARMAGTDLTPTAANPENGPGGRNLLYLNCDGSIGINPANPMLAFGAKIPHLQDIATAVSDYIKQFQTARFTANNVPEYLTPGNFAQNFQLWTPYPWLQWTTSAKPPYPYVRPTPLSPHAHPPAIASTNTTNPQPPLPPSQLPRPIHDATVRRTAKRLPELRSRGCCGQGQTVGVPHGFHVRA
jgi:hypothetical protein